MNPPQHLPIPTKGERELLRRWRAGLPPAARFPAGRSGVPFGDDMAAIDARDPSLLWTTDMLMDGVDFDSRRHDWHGIGRKALAVNLSDCAAMAVRPLAALCAVALNDALSMADAEALLAGIQDCGAGCNCPLVGGDTNSWAAPTVICVTVAGRALAGGPVLRSGAKPRDLVCVSGRLGGSILGRHLAFEPRLELAAAVAAELRPHAMIDISDGLSVDLGHILDESHCAAELDETALAAAIHPDAHLLAAQDGRPALEHALSDGEDFELLMALPPDASADACRRLGLLSVGVFVPGNGEITLRRADGTRSAIARHGWEHFR
jgi:thiamine-monophosphate kinase